MDAVLNYIKKFSVTEWLLFLVIMSFNSWWPIWNNSAAAPLCYGSILILLAKTFNSNRHSLINNGAVTFLLLLYFVVLQTANTIHLSSIFIVVAYMLSTTLNANESKNVIKLLTDYLALSIIISLPFWIVHEFVYQLPVYQIMDISSWKGNDGQYYLNYFFFIAVEGIEAHRFYSLFDEPGVLGTLSAFLLWANQYNFKDKRCLIIFIGSLFTFSMAFYILSVFGWICSTKIKLSSLIIRISLFLLVCLVLATFLSDNLAFQQSILYRIANFEETGVHSRTSYEFNLLWSDFIVSPSVFFGLGSGAVDELGGNTSYRFFVLEYGVIGLILLISAYYCNIRKKNYLALMTLFIFILSFLQRPALFTAANIFLFTCIVRNFETKNQAV